jgi:hypothetical protein
MSYITLATEDELSEAIALKLVEDVGLTAYQCLRKGGFGYLKSRIPNFCELAIHNPVFILTDLDRAECAPLLIAKWFENSTRPQNLLFRVAEREVESWLLADHHAMKTILGSRAKLPNNPDSLDDPKQSLLLLARKARRTVRDDLLIDHGSISSQGLGYNARLGFLIQHEWSIARAAMRSPSLAKAWQRLKELAITINAEINRLP